MLPSVRLCQNRGGTCLRNLLSAFNLPSAEKGRQTERKKETTHRGKVINHAVEKGVTNLSPISKTSHYSFCFPTPLVFPCLRQKGSNQAEVDYFSLRVCV